MIRVDERYVKLLSGQAIASLGVACVISSGMGTFPITAANLAISSTLGIPFGVANLGVEVGMVGYSMYRKEGIGIATILNAVAGGFLIDFFSSFLPTGWFMMGGLVLLPLGWGLMGMAGLGEPASNILMRALMKQTGKGVGLIRTIEESFFTLIGILGNAPVTPMTIVLSLGFGSVMSKIYKLMKYEPTKIEHKNLGGRK